MNDSPASARARRICPVRPDWASLPDEELLDVRFCELGLAIEGSSLEPRIQQLHDELAGRGITFRPHVWISDEWFTPDDVPGIAIPFYLVHPRLAKLEERQMLEVEGGTPEWCLQILRHEVGHAIDNAYRLRSRRQRVKLFGRPSTEYPEYYTPKPYSKSFVLHLDAWYAQSHPDEDFAETFAVWLNPDSDWKARYAGWPAARKLRYMDRLMQDIATRRPILRTRRRVDPVETIRRTLRAHYQKKRRHYSVEYPNFYDRDLRLLFSDATAHASSPKASRFINRVRKDVRRMVTGWTGAYQYTIDRVLEDMIARCDELGLHLREAEDQTKLDFVVLLTVQTMNYLHSGRHRVAL